ncbi:cytochrome P450 [Trametes punicea]|nr:cytochrome P450 [Trametes punicea]
MPWVHRWVGFRDLCTKYGDLVYLNILGDHAVVVGSHRMAVELLDKRSSNTSDRPLGPTVRLTGFDEMLSLMEYDQRWREHRRAFWQIFYPGIVQDYRVIQHSFRERFLAKLAQSPDDFKQHLRYIFSATTLKVLYDIDAEDEGDRCISAITQSLHYGAELITGVHPLDLFPFLQYIPAWFPGMGLKHSLARCKAAVTYAKEVPFAVMKAALGQGRSDSCALAALMSRVEHENGAATKDHHEELVKNIGLVAFAGGSDTSFSVLLGFFLAMSLYPDVQRKAQAELDAVVGPHRLPDYSDRDALVYVNAIIKEALRWHLVLPLSLPHRTVEDDEVDGYFVPAGTVVIPNVWAITHDPEAYDNPHEFMPERFIHDGKLDPTVRDPSAHVFGYGRRRVVDACSQLYTAICPGRYFADDMLFLSIASILHVFNIEPPRHEDGKPISIEYRPTDGVLSYPEDCRCTIKLRSADAALLVSQVGC